MAEKFRPDYVSNRYRVDPIYARMTLPRGTNDGRGSLPGVQELFGELSQTSQFKVTLHLGDTYPTENSDTDVNAWLVSCGVLGSNLFNGNNSDLNSLRYEFMCHEATLPGSNLGTFEEPGSRQGLTEKFATSRTFSRFSLQFYVDAEYGIVRLFEEWMNFINPLYDTSIGRKRSGDPRGGVGQFDNNQIFRFRYPETYKREISITKFERDMFYNQGKGEFSRTPSMMTYKFLNAFPVQLTAIPLSYDTSNITVTTVEFEYDRYVTLNHQGTGSTDEFPSDFLDQLNDAQRVLTSRPLVTFSSGEQSKGQFSGSNPDLGLQ